ncbi:MAG: thiamine ABC transporter substrate-binding protein [Thermoplasmata archaeon]
MEEEKMDRTTKMAVAGIVVGIIAVGMLAAFFILRSGEKEPDLVIYSYDSFAAMADAVVKKFESQTGLKVKLYLYEDGGSVITQAEAEKGKPKADLLIGIDNSLLARSRKAGILEPYTPPSYQKIPDWLKFDSSGNLTPFDYGYIAIAYNSSALQEPPRNFTDLTDPKYAGKILLQDPSSSTVGASFMMYCAIMSGENYTTFLQGLKGNVKAIKSGWYSSFKDFEAGEAPMFVSYSTDLAYSVHEYGNTKYNVTIPSNTGYAQIEGMGIVKGAAHRTAAEQFIEFALSPAFQQEIPLNNWMLPVIPDTPLPQVFKDYVVIPSANCTVDSNYLAANYETWLTQWRNVMNV